MEYRTYSEINLNEIIRQGILDFENKNYVNKTLSILKKDGNFTIFGDKLKCSKKYGGLFVILCDDYKTKNSKWYYKINENDSSTYKLVFIPYNEKYKELINDSKYTFNVISAYVYSVLNNKYTIKQIESDKYIVKVNNETDIIDKTINVKKKIDDPILEINSDSDRNYTKFTKRELACIYLKVPNSGTKWLDELIKLSINN